jgi:hypothetical protein
VNITLYWLTCLMSITFMLRRGYLHCLSKENKTRLEFHCMPSDKKFNVIFNCTSIAYLLIITFFITMLGGSTLWHLQRFLQCIKHIMLEFTPSTALFHLPPLMVPPLIEQFRQVIILIIIKKNKLK